MSFQTLMIVIPTRVKTMEHVLTELVTTLVLAHLDLKGETAASVRSLYL